jgi:hypothetical protein
MVKEPKVNFMGDKEYSQFKQLAGDTQPYANKFEKDFQKRSNLDIGLENDTPTGDLGSQDNIIDGAEVALNNIPTSNPPIYGIPTPPPVDEIEDNIT